MMEAVKVIEEKENSSLDIRSLSKEELAKTLALFVWTIRRIRVCGKREIADKIVYYERQIRNSGIWLSGTSMNSNRLSGGVYYYLSCSSENDEELRQWVNFDCKDSLALITSCSDDIKTLVDVCEFLEGDFKRILWQIESYKD